MGKYVIQTEMNEYRDSVCMRYFNLLHLFKTTGKVPFDRQFLEARHRYTNVLYFISAVSYKSNRNYIVVGSVKTTYIFDNAVGDHDTKTWM